MSNSGFPYEDYVAHHIAQFPEYYADTPFMTSIFAIGLHGIRSGLERVEKGARELTRAFSPDATTDSAAAIIDTKLGARQVEASAKIIKVADEMNDSVLDIVA